MYVRTSDGVRLEIDPTLSQMLMDLLEDVSDADDVPLPTIDSTTLTYIKHWSETDEPIEESWDVLWRMAHAADYLNATDILDRTCQRMAEHLRGKSPAEIQKLLM